MKRKFRLSVFAGLVLIASPMVVKATIINFDFTPDNNGSLKVQSMTVNGVTATAWSYDYINNGIDNNNGYIPALLWGRNDNPSDHGVGVCTDSEGASCNSIKDGGGGGDVNEISDQYFFSNHISDVIELTNSNGGVWTSLYVSSLDSGGTNGNESGVLYWFEGDGEHSFAFSHDALGGGSEGDLFNIKDFSKTFNPSVEQIFFVSNNSNCVRTALDLCDNTKPLDNDYLVWKGSVSVPEPSVLTLVGLSLLGVGITLKRRCSSET